jgi:hypothetical protein
MVKDFIQYTEALELKQLGFDEPCFGRYNNNDNNLLIAHTEKYIISNGVDRSEFFTLAPTYSQAFRWFREKHNLRSFVDTIVHDVDSPNDWIYYFQVKMGNGIDTQPYYSGDFNSYEEAELGCLRKLIKKVKNK